MHGDIRYAKHGDAHLAYRVRGEGPVLVWLPSNFIPIDAMAEEPSYERFLDRLAAFSTLITFDRLGVGLSDPIPSGEPPTIEDWADQVVSILDAAAAGRAWLLANAAGAMPAVVLAAQRPERVSGLLLALSAGSFKIDDDEPQYQELLDATNPAAEPVVDFLAAFAPSRASDARFRHWWDSAGRRGASPSVARMLLELQGQGDVTSLAPQVMAPTLVIVRPGYRPPDPRLNMGWGAEIPGARVVEVGGIDAMPWLDCDELMAEVEDFVTGIRAPAPALRALRTVMFTDVVGSTSEAARLGDAGWRDVLETHDRVVRGVLARHGGHEIDTAGDGFLVTFESPTPAVQCATRLHHAVTDLGLQLRIGIHCGEVEVRGANIAGMSVHIAARVQALARPGETLVSSTVREIMAGSGVVFVPRGQHALKGVPDEWCLFAAP